MNKVSNNIFSCVDFSSKENVELINRLQSFYEKASLELTIIGEFGQTMPSLKNLVYKKLIY